MTIDARALTPLAGSRRVDGALVDRHSWTEIPTDCVIHQ